MTQAETIASLQQIFDDLFMDKVILTPELTAGEVEEWDSLTQISLMLAVEKRFNVRFRVGEVEKTRNVGELADLIARRAGGGSIAIFRFCFARNSSYNSVCAKISRCSA
jgi:acyl carrier protein